jgi:hypothetical protein
MAAMSFVRRAVSVVGATTALAILSYGSASAQRLTNGTDVVGNPIFGATVQTFIDLGYDVTGDVYIENALWSNPTGFGLGSYIKGADGFGTGTNNSVLGAYDGSGSVAANANGLDHAWVQDTGNTMLFGSKFGGSPSNGIIWDLGGQANQAALFVFVDHGPVPGEVLENTVWLSNDPNAADGDWQAASLTHVYGAGWEDDPTISDGFVTVYTLPNDATFRYVSVTWGGPGSITQDGDNEIDAVGGLNARGTGVRDVPEPGVLAFLGAAIGMIPVMRRKMSRR